MTSPFRVCVIDDDESTVEIIAAFLQDLPDVQTQVYTSPRFFLGELQATALQDFPQLIFSDLVMPEYTGMELIDRIAELCGIRQIPMPQVVFISGNVDDTGANDEIRSSIHGRGFSTISKPFRMENIVQETKRLLLLSRA